MAGDILPSFESDLPNPAPALYYGVLVTDDGHYFRGVAEFEMFGITITGRIINPRSEVVGLPERTQFVPYAHIQRFEYEQPPEVEDKLFGGTD